GGRLLDVDELGRGRRLPARGSGAPARGLASDVVAQAVTDGVVLYDKPPALTSHDVVARMRRALGARARGAGRLRVGHAGTLDPFATGLLLILDRKSTRLNSSHLVISYAVFCLKKKNTR